MSKVQQQDKLFYTGYIAREHDTIAVRRQHFQDSKCISVIQLSQWKYDVGTKGFPTGSRIRSDICSYIVRILSGANTSSLSVQRKLVDLTHSFVLPIVTSVTSSLVATSVKYPQHEHDTVAVTRQHFQDSECVSTLQLSQWKCKCKRFFYWALESEMELLQLHR